MTRTKALWLLALLILAVVVGSSAAFSYPTLQGPTGLVLLPDANVEPRGQWTLAADYIKVDGDKVPSFAVEGPSQYLEDLNVCPIRLVWGVSNMAELWAAYTDIRDDEAVNLWSGGVKIQVHNNPATGVKVAFGGGHSSLQDDVGLDVTADTIYGVVTKESRATGQWRWKGSLGVMYTKFKPEGAPEDEEEKILEPFVGLEVTAGNLALLGEYRAKEANVDDEAMWSAGARYMITPNLGIQAGVTNGAIFGIGGPGTSVYYGLSFTVGGGRGDMEEEVY